MFAGNQTFPARTPAPDGAPSPLPGLHAPQVVSASRRTDIPACYPDWLVSRLRAGWVQCYHPFTGAAHGISLSPADVVALVLWTHNCGPFLPFLPLLDRMGHAYYFLHTLTALPKNLEPGLPDPADLLRAMRQLAERIGAQRMHWRYDPIVVTGDLDEAYHLSNFGRLANALEGATERVIMSFVYPYARVVRRLRRANLGWHDPSPALKTELTARLAEVARDHGMRLVSCCPDYPLPENAGPSRCLDPALLRLLRPDVDSQYPPGPTRRGCGCARSIDIGAYDTCAHACLYCYATSRPLLAQRRWQAHSPSSPSLLPPPGGGANP